MGKQGEDRKEALGKYLRYSHLGIQFLLAVGLPVAGGVYLDQRLGTKVLFTLLGLALGFTAGIYSLYGELFRRRDGDSPGKIPGNHKRDDE